MKESQTSHLVYEKTKYSLLVLSTAVWSLYYTVVRSQIYWQQFVVCFDFYVCDLKSHSSCKVVINIERDQTFVSLPILPNAL